MRGFRKERNMHLNPKVTVLAYDPRHPLQYLEVRGIVVEMTEKGALEQLDEVSRLYTGQSPYFGKCVPESLKEVEVPVLCKITPLHVVRMDATKNNYPRILYDARASGPRETPSFRPHVRESVTSCRVPASHIDLLDKPFHGVLTTMMPDGQPQSSLVWYGYDGECARIGTTEQRQKGRNMMTNPLVSLLIVDPEDTSRYIQIQGTVEMTRERAVEELDGLTRRYTKHPHYYGYIYPIEQMAKETRITCKIHATAITLDAIHRDGNDASLPDPKTSWSEP
jgi:PPOX class probable F420-dependent enzyme